jgi:hypothetical protein
VSRDFLDGFGRAGDRNDTKGQRVTGMDGGGKHDEGQTSHMISMSSP